MIQRAKLCDLTLRQARQICKTGPILSPVKMFLQGYNYAQKQLEKPARYLIDADEASKITKEAKDFEHYRILTDEYVIITKSIFISAQLGHNRIWVVVKDNEVLRKLRKDGFEVIPSCSIFSPNKYKIAW